MQPDAGPSAGHALGYLGSRLDVDPQQLRSAAKGKSLIRCPQTMDRSEGLCPVGIGAVLMVT